MPDAWSNTTSYDTPKCIPKKKMRFASICACKLKYKMFDEERLSPYTKKTLNFVICKDSNRII